VPSQKRPLFARLLISMTLALGLLALPVALDTFTALDTGALAVAGNGNGPGGPGDGGGGGDPGAGGGSGGPGGNMGGGKGGGKPDKGGLFGDQVYILRYADGEAPGIPGGVPKLFKSTDAEGNPYSCFQPLAIGGPWPEPVPLPLVGQFADPNDIKLDAEMEAFCEDPEVLAQRVRTRDRIKIHDKKGKRDRIGAPIRLDAEDDTELDGCDVVPVCADNATEVELGRLSVLRAPAKVLDRQRDEAIRNILKYWDDVALDHGGRLVVGGSTFDSPLINLALMREFMNWGQLKDDMGPVWAPPEWFDKQYDHGLAAAFGLGAGDDKLGAGVDQEVVIRSYLTIGIPGTTEMFPDPYQLSASEDPSGVTAGRAYLDFGNFSYTRSTVFTGGICWDKRTADGYVRNYGSIMDVVFDGDDYTGSGLAAFAQAADDARNVLVAVHDGVEPNDTGLLYYVDYVFESYFDGMDFDPVFCPELP
jgi:hypothetical protein